VSVTVPLPFESLVHDSVLDAELGALASMLVEARVPVVVAGDVAASTRARVLDAFLAALPADVRRIELAGPTEDFAWLPEAETLGWRSDGPTPGRAPIEPAAADETVILAGDLTQDGLGATWSGVVRICVRAVSVGYGLAATVEASSLEEALRRLREPPFRLTEDELSRLGLVVVLADGPDDRVVAAHYVRPVARDVHGHIQKLGPAVRATWDERAGRFEHFGWGVTPELAMRTGRHAGDFEIELDRRREALERRTT
jgi:endonuclease/exonuclease/phosphatase (EEP) superfamily protein YafD